MTETGRFDRFFVGFRSGIMSFEREPKNMLNFHRRRKLFLGFLMLGALVALMLGCTPGDPQSTFDADGPVAQSQLNLFWIILGAGAVVFVAVQGALIYLLIKFRRRRDDDIPEQVEGNHTLEFAWTAGPTAIVILVAIPTIFTIFDNQVSPEPGALTVDVIGHQWWFEFRYDHPDDPTKDVVFAGDLHIPVHEVINVNLDSVDVIHSFWIPKIAGKVDMVPNNDNTMWIQSDQTGTYYGQCAEFCGVQHANMRFKVIVHTREDFDAWLRAEATPPEESQDPLVAEGKKVFRSASAGCSGCHATDPISNDGVAGREGPNLAHVASRTNLAGGMFDNRDESGNVNLSILQDNLRTWISDPESVKPGNTMASEGAAYIDPENALTEAELSAIVAYLSSLK